MKKTIIILTAILLTIPSYSQQRGTIVVKEGLNMTIDLADSLQYVLPHFSIGLVKFTDGNRSQALLNINTVMQAVRFIDDKTGDTLGVRNEKEIESVYVMNRYFLKKNGYQYFEILSPAKDVSIAICRILEFQEPPKEGAYGFKSYTSSIATYNNYSDYESGKMYNIENYLDIPWKYSIDVYIKNDQKLLISTPKNFKKSFPKHLSPFIDQYIKDNNLKLEKEKDAEQLLQACEEKLKETL